MIKKYFIAMDLYTQDYNKFLYSISEIDLEKIGLVEAAKEIAEKHYPQLDISKFTIKVTAFNNIET